MKINIKRSLLWNVFRKLNVPEEDWRKMVGADHHYKNCNISQVGQQKVLHMWDIVICGEKAAYISLQITKGGKADYAVGEVPLKKAEEMAKDFSSYNTDCASYYYEGDSRYKHMAAVHAISHLSDLIGGAIPPVECW